ncbi:MAG TPA: energy transducer TonB [Acidobacteriaceae bacterium]|jgi:TonB family protein|nr:energy transducer TonB [Acidobacteriaceae bacterium]
MAQTTQAELEGRLLNRDVFLRGFWRDNKLEFDRSGKPVRAFREGSFTVAGVRVTSVEIRHDGLLITGQREGLAFGHDQMTQVPLGPEGGVKVRIHGRPGEDFGSALDAVFAPNLPSLAPSLPEFWQPYAQTHFEGSQPDAAPPTVTPQHKAGMSPPVVLRQMDPKFSPEAKAKGYSGMCRVRLNVLPDGTPDHLQITVPAGLGLDEQAIESLLQYRFRPAQMDGHPVEVELIVDVHFVMR